MRIITTKTSLLFSALFLSSLILFQSCLVTYGDNMHATFTPIEKPIATKKADKIYLFFHGEPIDFNYRKIGLIECQGHQYANNTIILDYMKYHARNNHANAIINISDGLKPRETGRLLDTVKYVYPSTTFKGIAVHIEIDSAFLAKHGAEPDTTFIRNVRFENDLAAQKQQSQFGAYIFVGILALVVVVIAVLAQDKPELPTQ